MMHIIDDYWEVSTNSADLGPIPKEDLEDFWNWLIEEFGEDLDDSD